MFENFFPEADSCLYQGVRQYAIPQSEKSCFFNASFFSLVKITGSDALDWLNAQTTADLKRASLDTWILNSYNNPKGKVISVFFMKKTKESLILLVEKAALEDMQKMFEFYIFSEDVKIETADSFLLGQFCNSQKDLIEQGDIHFLGQIPFFADSFFYEIKNPDFLEKIKAEKNFTSAFEIEKKRIESQFPLLQSEYPAQSVLAAELNLKDMISYSKGCYVGQEVFARIKTYGHTNKSLVRISFPPESAQNVLGKDVEMRKACRGTITSALNLKDKTIALGWIPTAYLGQEFNVTVNQIPGEVF